MSLADVTNDFFGPDASATDPSAAPAKPASLKDVESNFFDPKPSRSNEIPAAAKFTGPDTRGDTANFGGQTLQIGPLDTRIPLPASVTKGLAQIGSGLDDWRMGYKQLTGTANEADVDAKRAMDKPLNAGFVGTVNNILGKALPAAIVPYGWAKGAAGAAAPVIEGALAGLTQGVAEPVGTGESRAGNAAIGTLGGGAIPAVLSGAGQILKPAIQNLDLVRKAQSMGIPLGPGDTSTNGLIQGVRSFLADMPVTGSMAKAHRDEVESAMARNLAAPAGASGLSATEWNAAKDSNKAAFNALWANPIEFTGNTFGGFRQIENDITTLKPAEQQHIQGIIDHLQASAVQAPNGKLTWDGSLVNRVQSDLGSEAAKGGMAAGTYKNLQKVLLGAFEETNGAADRAGLADAKSKYMAIKTLDPLVNKSNAGVAGRDSGDILALAPSAIASKYRDVASSPFADIAPIVGKYGVDRTPKTGGSMRALVQNTALGLAGVGTYTHGLTGALTAAGGAGAILGGGTAAQKVLSSPAITRLALGSPSGSISRLLPTPPLRAIGMQGASALPAATGLSGINGAFSSPTAE